MNLVFLISLIIVLINVALIALGFWIGYRRGSGKTIVRLAYILVILLMSYVLAILIATPLAGVALNIIQKNYSESIRQYAEYSENFEFLIKGILTSLIAPIMFTVIFLILQGLSMIFFGKASDKLVSLVKKDGDPLTQKSRFIGGAVGVVQGVLIAMVLCVPFSLAATLLSPLYSDDTTNETLNNTSSDKSVQIMSEGELLIMPTALASHSVADDSASIFKFNLILQFGSLTQMRIPLPGPNCDLLTDGLILMQAYSRIEDLLSPFNGVLPEDAHDEEDDNSVNDTTDDQTNDSGADSSIDSIIDVIASIIPYIKQSDLLAEFTADLLNTSATIWSDGGEFLGISFENYDENSSVSAIVDSVLKALSDASADNAADILTAIFIPKNDGDTSPAMLMASLDGGIDYNSEDTLNDLADMLIAAKQNDDTAGITNTMGDVGKQLISDAGIETIPSVNEDAYKEIQTALEDSLGDIGDNSDYESTVNQLANDIVGISSSYGYTVSLGQARLLAISLLEYFGSVENITVDGLKEYFGVTEDTFETPESGQPQGPSAPTP